MSKKLLSDFTEKNKEKLSKEIDKYDTWTEKKNIFTERKLKLSRISLDDRWKRTDCEKKNEMIK